MLDSQQHDGDGDGNYTAAPGGKDDTPVTNSGTATVADTGKLQSRLTELQNRAASETMMAADAERFKNDAESLRNDIAESQGKSSSPAIFANAKEADAFANENVVSGASADEMSAAKATMIAYQDEDFSDINGGLRDGNLSSELSAKAKDIDAAVQSSELKKSVTLYRGQTMDSQSQITQLQELAKSGGEFSDPAFLSTSLDRSVAEDFATEGKVGAVFEIEAAAGQKVAYMNQWTGASPKDAIGSEMEMLLPRNSRLSVVSVEPIPGSKNGVFKVKMRVK